MPRYGYLNDRHASSRNKNSHTAPCLVTYSYSWLSLSWRQAALAACALGREQAKAWSIYAWEFRRSLRRPCQEPQTRCKNMSRAEGITNHRSEQIGCACSMSSTQAPRTCPARCKFLQDRAKIWNWNAKIATSAWRPGQWTPSTYSITHRRNQYRSSRHAYKIYAVR